MDQIHLILQKTKLWFIGSFDKVKGFLKEQWEERRALFLAVLGLILCVLILIILIGSLSKESPKKQLLDESSALEKTDADPYLTMPAEPTIEDGYVYSRTEVSRWTDQETESWFSVPEGTMLDGLTEANSKLIEDMMEVVP